MQPNRGWAFIEEEGEHFDPETPEGMAIEKRIDALTARWSQLQKSQEQRRFVEEAESERGWGRSEEDEEEVAAREDYRAQHESQVELEMNEIETLLAHYGVRMMRPYEHWNEDERYMEYMERDRDEYNDNPDRRVATEIVREAKRVGTVVQGSAPLRVKFSSKSTPVTHVVITFDGAWDLWTEGGDHLDVAYNESDAVEAVMAQM
jgi:hypothetical protein